MRNNRRGSLMVEVSVSLVILTALIALVAQSVVGISRQRRSLQKRQLAILEANNLMDRIIARPRSGITAQSMAEIKQTSGFENNLPGAELSITVSEKESSLSAKKVTVRISWSNNAGIEIAPVQLVAWKYHEKIEE